MKRTTGELYFYQHSWPLYPDDSPCDVDFVEYLERHEITNKVLFHFGTGSHHLVGKHNHERGNPNEIVGVTASYQPKSGRSKEHDSYLQFIIGNAAAANYYRVWFADIYTLSPKVLPSFDIVTLFHLFEFYDEKYSAYARLDDVKLVDMFLTKLNPGGKILFFPKPNPPDPSVLGKRCLIAKAKTRELIQELVAGGRLVVEEQYKSIVVCAVP